jgi:predicted peroxiredoxin
MIDEQNSKKTQGIEQQGKRDFMKTIGAGLGAAGLATLMGGQAMAADEAKQRYIVVATHGGNDPNRAILALLTAVTALDKGFGSVHVWLTIDGADMANKAKVGKIISPIYKSFGTAEELINKLKAKGATFGVCPPCAEYMGADGSNRIDFVEKQGADWLMKNIPGAAVVWF